MKTLYLMRHGQTLFNVRKKIQGSCDSPLTDLGIDQALVAKEALTNINFDNYYCSTSERASDTLELVIGDSTKYTRLKGLKEWDFGTYEGESEDLNPRWENGYDIVFSNSGGEKATDVMKRMKDSLIAIMEQDQNDTVLAVSHSGASMCFMMNWETDETIQRVFADGGFPNCCVAKYSYENHKFKFVEMIRHDFTQIEKGNV